MRVRAGRVGALAVLGFILGAIFFTGFLFYTILRPDLGLAYDIGNPNQPFTYKGYEKQGTDPAAPTLSLSFNETLTVLVDGGCSFIEGEPENLDPEKCVFLSQKDFIETALHRKLVFTQMGEEECTLYVPVKEGHVACRWSREPA